MRCAIILAVLSVALAASVAPQQRIVGGQPTTINKYPFAAHVQTGLLGVLYGPLCGGFIISNTVVISAAHCFQGSPLLTYRVRLGSSYSASGGSIFNLRSLLNHPDYVDRTLVNDVAILKLLRPIIFNDVMKAARIPSSAYVVADDTELTVVGWGNLYSAGPAPEMLHEVQVLKVNTTICAERYRALNASSSYPYPEVTDTMLCSGVDVDRKGFCQGDSGGPVFMNNDIVVGIVSWSHLECAEPTYPGVSTLVSAFTDWILANAA